MGLLVIGQCIVYIIQIISAIHLLTSSDNTNQLNTQATLVVIFFAFGVIRAWEYVGGQRTGLWGTVGEVGRTVIRGGAQTVMRSRTTNRNILPIRVRRPTDVEPA
jgi:hypothetical protein